MEVLDLISGLGGLALDFGSVFFISSKTDFLGTGFKVTPHGVEVSLAPLAKYVLTVLLVVTLAPLLSVLVSLVDCSSVILDLWANQNITVEKFEIKKISRLKIIRQIKILPSLKK